MKLIEMGGSQILSKTNLWSPLPGNMVAPRCLSGSGFDVHRRQPCRVSFCPAKNSLNLPFLSLRSADSFGRTRGNLRPQALASGSQVSLGLGKSLKWWEKGLQSNMKEVTGARDLVESLVCAGDKLVVVGFFSPGCGGCRALHPKLCQLAEMNQDVQFLHVNYEEHKSMCYSLNVHVLPFFRFYRGAHGRLCSFSCTNATIKKFKDALAKHKPDRCSLGPPKGLEEKELVALSANKDLDFTYAPEAEEQLPVPAEREFKTETEPARVPVSHLPLPLPSQSARDSKDLQDFKDKSLVPSRR